MRLVFPSHAHVDVVLQPGELSLGASDECDIRLPDVGWLPHHATLTIDSQRGLWLRLEPNVRAIHVNARPVRECAMLRVGDIVTLGDVQFCVMLQKEGDIVRQLPPRRNVPMEEAERAAASRAVLRGVAGLFHGRTFPLATGVTIGSAATSDIRIEDVGVASQHACIELNQERVTLRAQAPGNVLKVNGVLVEDAMLHPGDQLVMGTHRFVVEAPGLPARGGSLSSPRQRPITQAIPAVTTPPPASRRPEPVPESPRGRFSAWWLLAAAAGIALVLVGILNYAPR